MNYFAGRAVHGSLVNVHELDIFSSCVLYGVLHWGLRCIIGGGKNARLRADTETHLDIFGEIVTPAVAVHRCCFGELTAVNPSLNEYCCSCAEVSLRERQPHCVHILVNFSPHELLAGLVRGCVLEDPCSHCLLHVDWARQGLATEGTNNHVRKHCMGSHMPNSLARLHPVTCCTVAANPSFAQTMWSSFGEEVNCSRLVVLKMLAPTWLPIQPVPQAGWLAGWLSFASFDRIKELTTAERLHVPLVDVRPSKLMGQPGVLNLSPPSTWHHCAFARVCRASEHAARRAHECYERLSVLGEGQNKDKRKTQNKNKRN